MPVQQPEILDGRFAAMVPTRLMMWLRRRSWLGLSAAAISLGSFAACGPIGYVRNVTIGASDAVEAARQAGADQHSPYWWTRAVEYLHEARVEAAAADFEAADRYGEISIEAAHKAKVQALDIAAHPDHEFVPPKPDVKPPISPDLDRAHAEDNKPKYDAGDTGPKKKPSKKAKPKLAPADGADEAPPSKATVAP